MMSANRVGDLTLDELRQLLREEFRSLIREAIDEAMEVTVDDDDFDDNTNFKPEVAEQLRRFLREQPDGEPVDDILDELGLNG